jgi:hypothetical protein
MSEQKIPPNNEFFHSRGYTVEMWGSGVCSWYKRSPKDKETDILVTGDGKYENHVPPTEGPWAVGYFTEEGRGPEKYSIVTTLDELSALLVRLEARWH